MRTARKITNDDWDRWSRYLKGQASKNLAKWGDQPLETLGLAVAEEAGEVCQAILKLKHESGDLFCVLNEAIDLGALCFQLMAAIECKEKYGSEDQDQA